jgi:hypothetical protein
VWLSALVLRPFGFVLVAPGRTQLVNSRTLSRIWLSAFMLPFLLVTLRAVAYRHLPVSRAMVHTTHATHTLDPVPGARLCMWMHGRPLEGAPAGDGIAA